MTRTMMRGLGYLVFAAAVAAGLIALVDDTTREQREQNQTAHAARLLREVLPTAEFDQAAGLEQIQLPGSTLTAYPVRIDGAVAALALQSVTPDGYVGPITLLTGVTPDGQVVGVRVANHRETPGLGDKIDISNSDWIRQFVGRQLDPLQQWALRSEGGDFDQISGATITSRAVINAVRDTLEKYSGNQTKPDTADNN